MRKRDALAEMRQSVSFFDQVAVVAGQLAQLPPDLQGEGAGLDVLFPLALLEA